MLCLNLKDLSIKNINTICDETGLVKYWSQPDFAYKSRVHIYDSEDNEIGYVQFKILSIQDGINFFDKEDNPIEMKDFKVVNQKDEYNFEIINNDNIVYVNRKEDSLLIKYDKNIDLNRCILFIVSLLNKE